MTITESRIRKGTLSLGGDGAGVGAVDFSCQPTAVAITSDFSEDGDPVETLCGDTILPTTTATATLTFTAIQDFADPEGLVQYTWDHNLEVVPFAWVPNPTVPPKFTGTVQVRRLDIGGDVNARLTSDAEWPIQDGPERDNTPPAVDATGATAGTPGTFTPAGATPPANLAAMSGITATPATAWTTGQYVALGDVSHAHWDGSAWTAGEAA